MTIDSGKLRRMRSELSYLQKADGSCSFSQGNTTVWASCSGPGDVHISRRENEQMHLDVSFRQTSGDSQHHRLNSVLESALQNTVNLTLYPRTCLTVTVHCLQSDGSLGAAALTAASLAMLDNGVVCKAPFCGVQVVRVDGQLTLDPDSKLESKADASFLFALAMGTGDGCPSLISSDSIGPFSAAEFSRALCLASQAATQIFDYLRETFQRKLSVDIFNRT